MSERTNIEELKPVKAKPIDADTIVCVLPAGSFLQTGDWYTVRLAHPLTVEIPIWALESVD